MAERTLGFNANDMTLALVVFQFLLILLLLLSASAELLSSSVAWILLAAGAMLGLWTLFFNRVGNFNIRPEPKASGKLVTTGPYRFIRHPMYLAVLLVMAPFGLYSQSILGPICWLLLLAVLWNKASVEEAMLARRFEEYECYKNSAGRFLPRLIRRRKG